LRPVPVRWNMGNLLTTWGTNSFSRDLLQWVCLKV